MVFLCWRRERRRVEKKVGFDYLDYHADQREELEFFERWGTESFFYFKLDQGII